MSKTIDRTIAVSLAGATLLALTAVAPSQAASIDTTPTWNGTDYIYAFGIPNTATYGQTFTVGLDTVLQDFSFWLGGYQGGSEPLAFAAYVAQWDGSKATGPILYSGFGPSKDVTNTTMEQFTFNTGGLNLVSGQQYVAFLSTSALSNTVPKFTGMGFLFQDVYDGGGFLYNNNGSDFSLLTSSPWSYYVSGMDAAFQANFTSAAAVPTPALLPGLVGMGIAALRKRKQAVAVSEDA